jgi:hypothetical protein
MTVQDLKLSWLMYANEVICGEQQLETAVGIQYFGDRFCLYHQGLPKEAEIVFEMLYTKSFFRMIAWENVPALCSKYFACNTDPVELFLFSDFSLVILFLLNWFYLKRFRLF